jgi:hypothetical protein
VTGRFSCAQTRSPFLRVCGRQMFVAVQHGQSIPRIKREKLRQPRRAGRQRQTEVRSRISCQITKMEKNPGFMVRRLRQTRPAHFVQRRNRSRITAISATYCVVRPTVWNPRCGACDRLALSTGPVKKNEIPVVLAFDSRGPPPYKPPPRRRAADAAADEKRLKRNSFFDRSGCLTL